MAFPKATQAQKDAYLKEILDNRPAGVTKEQYLQQIKDGPTDLPQEAPAKSNTNLYLIGAALVIIAVYFYFFKKK